MTLFNKQNTPEQWKKKYFELLDEHEKIQQRNDNNEELLCKTIIRLCLATTGFNKELDPYLKRIKHQLKKGLKSDQLKAELESFSNALMTMDDPDALESSNQASLLFDFLFTYFSEQNEPLNSIKEKFENQGFSNTQYLFVALNDLIDSIQQIEPIEKANPSTLQNDGIDSPSINSQLLLLLENTEIPPAFQPQAILLKDKLSKTNSLSSAFDETITLLLAIKKHIQSEQLAITTFLTQLTEQLTDLEQQASGVHLISTAHSDKINTMNQSVASQMTELQETSQNATVLEPLKQIIHSRLADIQHQIEQKKIIEQTERDQSHLQLKTLTKKIKSLEKESSHLKDKFVKARHQATRDPLTQLPNRLAYNEQIAIEIAQFNRYKRPLSILIWDIDLFKKINDTFGHKAGDKTLVYIAKLLSHHCRKSDFVSRFGGEEFTMLLTETDDQSALQAANKIRQAIEKTDFNSSGKKISITISCGITQFIENDTAESAFIRADNALYEAKNKGRNQCIIG